MKKIASLFMRDYGDGKRLVYDEVVPGSEWVQQGEGIATEKFDGTSCMIRNRHFYKRYDRKATKAAWKRQRAGQPLKPEDFKPAPDGWEACEPEPNLHTGHWPGWMPVGEGPEDKWHRAVWETISFPIDDVCTAEWYDDNREDTYELVGPKIGTNPYRLDRLQLWWHGEIRHEMKPEPPRTFDGLREWFKDHVIEGIVWHHPDGRMVKLKRRDFGYPWPMGS